jgi:hypothetical protein
MRRTPKRQYSYAGRCPECGARLLTSPSGYAVCEMGCGKLLHRVQGGPQIERGDWSKINLRRL